MASIIAELKKYSVITIIVSIVLGILLMIFPDQMITYTSVIIGAAIILSGVISFVFYFQDRDRTGSLVLGIIGVVAGIVICCCYKQIISIVVFILGIFLLIGGLIDFMNSVNKSIRAYKSWILSLILSLVSVAFGVIAIVNPFGTTKAVAQFIGIGFLLFAVLDLVSLIQVKKLEKDVEEVLNDIDDEPKATEVDYEEINEVDDN